MVNGSFGRSKGIYKWRKGWRADVLDGAVERRKLSPPAMPPLVPRERQLRTERIRRAVRRPDEIDRVTQRATARAKAEMEGEAEVGLRTGMEEGKEETRAHTLNARSALEEARIAAAWEWWRDVLGSPRCVHRALRFYLVLRPG